MANYSDENNSTYTIFCSRCGNEYSSDGRYCMKCGNLNPDHPQNKQYSKLINNHMESYSVSSSGQTQVEVNKNEVRGGGVNVSLGSNTGNFNTCFIINLLIYLVGILGSAFVFAALNGFDWRGIVSSWLFIVWIVYSILFILLYSVELVFMKMNKPWWSAIIPFYNNIVLSNALYKNPFMGVLTIIPIVGLIFQFILWYQVGAKFKRGGLFTMLLPFIMFPVIGYGGSSFDGQCFVSGANTLEKEFKKKNMFLTISVLFIFLGIAMYVYSNYNNIKEGSKNSAKLYFIPSVKIVVNSLDKKISEGKYTCKNDSKTGTLYFYYRDISDQFFIPYGVFVDTMSVAVRVEQGPDGNKYYISMTNGVDGFPETLSTEINSDTIVPFTTLDESHKNVSCRITS